MIDPKNPDYTNTPASDRRPAYSYAPADPTAPPVATIVTPFYNTGAVFHETARSILRQSFQQWEWLIVNDGSTQPEALAVLDEYRRLADSRVRVIDLPGNQGPGAARNRAFQAVRTPYVVQLDADDLLEPTSMEKWLWLLESYPEFACVNAFSVGFAAHEYLWEQGFHNGSASLEENHLTVAGAIRRTVVEAVGGYDETIRGGMEDWDFWLHCADEGYWGITLPEYLYWYRRRENHADRWENWDGGERERTFRKVLRQRYPRLWEGHFPDPQVAPLTPYETVSDALPWDNQLTKPKLRLLLIVPWLTMGGADKFNLDLLAQLVPHGWEVTLATTLGSEHPWAAQFARYTPDIFLLDRFLRPTDYPRFLRYLIRSRDVDAVLISNSEFGYHLLPYLRAHFPNLPLLDFCHSETEAWKNGGYPYMSVTYRDMLDRQLVTSRHLKDWMERRGADPTAIDVCYINVDAEYWRPDPDRGRRTRQRLEIEATTPVILFAGRVHEEKQPRVLAQTAACLAQVIPHFVLLVAGDGPDLGWLRTFVQENRLARQVRLLGAVPNAEIRDLLAAADVFFLPSRWEGIALSFYEALACGVPVVGAKVGGQAELVTPECGVLIERGEEAEEAQHYATVLAQLLRDPERRTAMSRHGHQRIQDSFRLEHMTEKLLAAYRAARQERASMAKPVPGIGLGHACAVQAVEYQRVSTIADWLWNERERGTGQAANTSLIQDRLLAAYDRSWRTVLYFFLRRIFLPSYRVALKHNMRWCLTVKDALKRFLLQRSQLR